MRLMKNKLAVTVIVLSASFLIIIGLSVGRKNATFAESGVGTALNEVQGRIYKVSSKISNQLSFLTHVNEIKSENQELKKKINDLANMEQHYEYLKNDNENLRKQLNFEKSSTNYTYKGADVVKGAAGNWVDELIINLGKDNGMEVGMVVLDNQGCLVGKITFLASNWSRIETLANSNIAVSAVVGGKPDNNGILKGLRESNNSIMASFNSLPLTSDIKKGDVVVTRGLDPGFPKDIRIGTVTEVQEDKGKLAKNAIVKPFAEFNKLQEVTIVMPKDKINVGY